MLLAQRVDLGAAGEQRERKCPNEYLQLAATQRVLNVFSVSCSVVLPVVRDDVSFLDGLASGAKFRKEYAMFCLNFLSFKGSYCFRVCDTLM